MRTKDFIYYASAAVLLAVTTQVAQADEVATQTPSVTEGNQYQSVIAAEIFGGEAALPVTPKSTVSAPAATSEVAKASAPAVSTSPASQSSEAATASTSVTSSVVSSESATASTSATNSETSNSAVATPAKLTNSTDVPSPTLKVQPKTFIDVSSHNGDISVDDYRALARQGVGGVVVKLTEDTWYNNPKAPSQVRNAQIAGLQVSTYHFSRYTTEEEARAEARFYIQAAQKLNLPKSTVMVNDFEDSNMLPNINRNTQAWVNEMRKHGYNNLMFYTSASWLDENNLGYRGPVSTSQFGIENFWVAQYPSSSLTATSAKNMRYNAKTGAWQFSATANLLPGKHVFDQSVDYTGRFTANASVEADPTQGDLSGTISIVNNNPTLGSFDVVISNVKAPNGVQTVSVPIWSEINGQDDIIWYTANRQNNGTYTVNVKASAHKNSTGLYNVHLYYVQKDGQLTGVGGTTTQVFIGKKPEISVFANLSISKNENNGTFTIIAKNLKGLEGYKEVKIPFWSHANGMSDIKWYTPTRQADGSYTVTVKASDHENANGRYEAQVFYIDARGQKRFVQKAFVERNDPSKPTGVISITNNKDSGTFDVVISDVYSPKGVRTVQVPIWSEVDGQDDIRWYEAVRQTNGSYKVTVQVANHKYSTGIYNVHLYYIQNDGSQIGVGGTQTNVTLSEPKADLAITGLNNATGSYDVVISNLIAPRGFKEVLVPTWSEKNGQDDIIWYKATMQANGDYKVTVRSSNHKGDSGLYNSHVYLVDNDGKYIGLGGKQVTLDITKTQGTLTIANNDKNRGTFDVLITNLTNPSGISGVLIPVWSEQNGQDDLVWHNATKQDDGSYKVTISASQHKWNSGKYIVHGYIVDASGKNIGFGATSADVVAPKKIGSASRGNYDVLNKVVYLDAGHGGYDPGASYFGISEKSLTLAIQSRVKAKLEAEGYQVVTTRTSDTYVDLTDRSHAANASESDIFVSIHINASGSSAAQGIETYYYQPYAEYPSRINATYHANPTRLSMSDTLANAIQSSLINATGAQNQGVKRQTFAVLRETTAPAVLLELGFLSNPQEAARLNTSAYQETLANAIVAGIKRYYSIYN
ncbi:GBS Bsp-like repeat-containing protein [Streptococcus salivarius]|uniref:GBS Bsp-like repeat-containing protein n=1 Tax=Streptococcus salivarius TaxID=1304 RepID=UPI0039C3562D